MDGYYSNKLYMTNEESKVLKKILDFVSSQGILNSNEMQILRHIIDKYTKPETIKK